MNEKELKETEGGWLFLAGIVVGYVGGEVLKEFIRLIKEGIFDYGVQIL